MIEKDTEIEGLIVGCRATLEANAPREAYVYGELLPGVPTAPMEAVTPTLSPE